MKCIDCVRCRFELENSKFCDYTGDELTQDEVKIPNKCDKFLSFPKDEMECPVCLGIMNYEGMDEDEPLKIYRCNNCRHVKFERVNGYEG